MKDFVDALTVFLFGLLVGAGVYAAYEVLTVPVGFQNLGY